MNLLHTLVIVCPLVFVTGLIDSIAWGLIFLPAYLFAGVPIHAAYCTNKFSSTLRFMKNGQVHYKSAMTAAIG